ncbi:MAG TPA: O-antigen ligase family protein [Alphaproteobacteria bacterium]|nr:O-antigen ligase family protein [Alphaproteobacteria bacterium]
MAAHRLRAAHAVRSPLDHGRVIQATAFATAPLAVVAPRALAILLPLAALTALAVSWRAGVRLRVPAATSLLVASFALWAAASAAWAEQPRLVWPALGQFAAMSIAGLALFAFVGALDVERRRGIEAALLVGAAVAWLLLAIEWASGLVFERSIAARFFVKEVYHGFIFNRGAAMLSMLVWPAALAAARRLGPWAGVATVVSVAALLTQFESMAALLGLAGGGIVALCALRWPRVTGPALAAVLVAGALAAPWIVRIPLGETFGARTDVSISITHRIKIWRFVSDAIGERPAVGWGLNAARELPGRLSTDGAARIAPTTEEISLHPHNAFLQIWLELGVVGVVMTCLLLWRVTRGAWRLADGGGRGAAAVTLAAIAAGSLVAVTGYGIWQAWWLAGLWLAAALIAAVAQGGDATATAR